VEAQSVEKRGAGNVYQSCGRRRDLGAAGLSDGLARRDVAITASGWQWGWSMEERRSATRQVERRQGDPRVIRARYRHAGGKLPRFLHNEEWQGWLRRLFCGAERGRRRTRQKAHTLCRIAAAWAQLKAHSDSFDECAAKARGVPTLMQVAAPSVLERMEVRHLSQAASDRLLLPRPNSTQETPSRGKSHVTEAWSCHSLPDVGEQWKFQCSSRVSLYDPHV